MTLPPLVFPGHTFAYITKWPNLKLKTWPKQLLGCLPLAFVLPVLFHYHRTRAGIVKLFLFRMVRLSMVQFFYHKENELTLLSNSQTN